MERGLDKAKASLAQVKAEYALYYNRRREPAGVGDLDELRGNLRRFPQVVVAMSRLGS